MSSTHTIHIPYKPLSVNECWQGKRFKTARYKAYEVRVKKALRRDLQIEDGTLLGMEITAYVANRQADVDNVAKPLIDIMQKYYGFDDRHIQEIHLYKRKVEKGEESVHITLWEVDQ